MITARIYSLALVFLLSGVAMPDTAAGEEIEVAASDNPEYGARINRDGWINFALYSPAASAVNLLLYAAPDAKSPSRVIPMQRNGDDWRIRIRGGEAKPGLHYMYQAKGAAGIVARPTIRGHVQRRVPVKRSLCLSDRRSQLLACIRRNAVCR